jgi:hypothetical protein
LENIQKHCKVWSCYLLVVLHSDILHPTIHSRCVQPLCNLQAEMLKIYVVLQDVSGFWLIEGSSLMSAHWIVIRLWAIVDLLKLNTL